MLIPKYNDLNSNNCTERSILLHYPDFWNYIQETYKDNPIKWTEKLYWYYNNLTDYPRCQICGKQTTFVNLKVGYREFCSTLCMNTSSDIQLRKQKTCEERYGVSNPMQSNEYKLKQQKTCEERYGVSNPFASEEIKEKIRCTNKIKYGCEYPMMNPMTRGKSRQTCLEKYGVEYTGQIPESIELKKEKMVDTVKKLKQTMHQNFLQSHPEFIDITENSYICRCQNCNCDLYNECNRQFEIPKYSYLYRIKNSIPLCTIKNPITNNSGTSIELFIRQILDKHNIQYLTNVRDVISPKELDIYIPSHHLAIECNGVYWHSSNQKGNHYHHNKWKECKENGIQLLTIWEDWILNKSNVIESLLLSKLGIYKKRLGARQCDIKQISSREANAFLNQNHIQGECSSSVRYGLYYDDKLMSIMTFSKKRCPIIGKGDWELVRYCVDSNYQIINGAEKMLKHFISDYQPLSIYSFSSNDISNGNLYKKLGFEMIDENKSYWYIEPNTFKRYHRSSFTKDAIVKRGWKENKNGWTEFEIMEDMGYIRIHDSGQTKWQINFK